MNNPISLPADLQSVVGSDPVDFTIFSKRSRPLLGSVIQLIVGIIFTLITSIGMIIVLLMLFVFKTPLAYVPALFLSVFVLVGFGVMIFGLRWIFQNGGCFVGTSNRLIRYHRGRITTYDWEQFSGNMEINPSKGSMIMSLKTGRFINSTNHSSRFVYDSVYITGVPNILEIEQICRKRIKEHHSANGD